MKYTNVNDIPLSVAAWLADDTYAHNPDPNTFSVTHLIKPLKSIILMRRHAIAGQNDLMDFLASKVGTAVHSGVEDTWRNRGAAALKKMGYPEAVWKNIQINPAPEDRLDPNKINIYIEMRGNKKVGKHTVSGMFDFVAEGQIEDFKNKKVWAWVFYDQDDELEFKLQGSMYRWLFPDIITEDTIGINYIFSDWKKMDAMKGGNYPSAPIKQRRVPLLSIQDTEKWVTDRLHKIDHYAQAKQADIPECTKGELWQKDAVWKYYKDPTKQKKSTKNFDNPGAANAMCAAKGGVVIEFPGEVKRCHYCNAAPVCKQREAFELSGLLKPL